MRMHVATCLLDYGPYSSMWLQRHVHPASASVMPLIITSHVADDEYVCISHSCMHATRLFTVDRGRGPQCLHWLDLRMQCCMLENQSSSDPAAFGMPFLFFLGFLGLVLAAAFACSASRRSRSCSCSCMLSRYCKSGQALLCGQKPSSQAACCMRTCMMCAHTLACC